MVYGLYHSFFAISARRLSYDGSIDEARVLTGVYMNVLTNTLTGVAMHRCGVFPVFAARFFWYNPIL